MEITKTFWLPISVAQLALEEKEANALRLYLWFKLSANDRVYADNLDLKEIAKQLSYKTDRSVKNGIKRLIELGWIGYSAEANKYYIRSINRLCQKAFRSKRCVEVSLSDLGHFKAFLAGAVITNMVEVSKKKAYRQERLKGRSKPSRSILPKTYPVACEALAKILNMSISTAHALKKSAKRYKYMNLKKNILEDLSKMPKDGLVFKNIEHHKIKRAKRGKKYILGPDLVCSNMITLKRKRLKSKNIISREKNRSI